MKLWWILFEIWLRFVWDLVEICLRFGWDLVEIWLRFGWDDPRPNAVMGPVPMFCIILDWNLRGSHLGAIVFVLQSRIISPKVNQKKPIFLYQIYNSWFRAFPDVAGPNFYFISVYTPPFLAYVTSVTVTIYFWYFISVYTKNFFCHICIPYFWYSS